MTIWMIWMSAAMEAARSSLSIALHSSSCEKMPRILVKVRLRFRARARARARARVRVGVGVRVRVKG